MKGMKTFSHRCGCHAKEDKSSTRTAVIKLIIASFLGLIFMIVEFTGGYMANSLAVMTDAAHMLSDVTSFIISLMAIYLGKQKPSKYFTFGWQRSEVLGALLSVLVIYGIAAYLFYESLVRITNPDSFEVNPNIMLISGCIGLFINVMLCGVLYGEGEEGHGHSHGGHSHKKKKQKGEEVSKEEKEKRKNINLRAAMIHVIGDLLQTVGVVVAGYIIWFNYEWKLADPICTLIFAFIMTCTTCRILIDIVRILLEGVPGGISFIEVRDDLYAVDGVKQIHSLYIWGITPDKLALASHVAIEEGKDHNEVLEAAKALLKDEHGFALITIQVEPYRTDMDTCQICMDEKKRVKSDPFSLKKVFTK